MNPNPQKINAVPLSCFRDFSVNIFDNLILISNCSPTNLLTNFENLRFKCLLILCFFPPPPSGGQESDLLHRSRLVKSDSPYIFSNYGALDLSNDEAQHPDSEVKQTSFHPPINPSSILRGGGGGGGQPQLCAWFLV